jgi:flagellar hook-associated protein 1 FlgK
MGSFLGLNIARTGLLINQNGLNVTAKNISNANTAGYTRQRVISVPAPYNQGVQLLDIEQVREHFLDNQYRAEASSFGEWQIKADVSLAIEDVFQEPSDYGLSAAVDNFFGAVWEMSNEPESAEMRAQVRQNAVDLTDTLNYIYHKLITMQEHQNEEISVIVSSINGYAEDIKTLNEQISRYEQTGGNANELRDQRNIILDKLSELVDISTTQNLDGSVSVMIGGVYLVDKKLVNKIEASLDKPNPIEGEGMLVSVKWENGDDVYISAGKLKGYLDMRDGTGITAGDETKAMGIPYFINKINVFANSIAETVNEIHKQGYTIPNFTNGNVSTTGNLFFDSSDGEKITAKNITIAEEIKDSVFNIASSDTAVSEHNKGNSGIISKIAKLQTAMDISAGDVGSFSSYTKQIASEIALVASQSSNKLKGQSIIVQSISDRRASVSGVSIDEEMTNMIQFQHAYSAAARLMSAINENLDILINRMF